MTDTMPVLPTGSGCYILAALSNGCILEGTVIENNVPVLSIILFSLRSYGPLHNLMYMGLTCKDKRHQRLSSAGRKEVQHGTQQKFNVVTAFPSRLPTALPAAYLCRSRLDKLYCTLYLAPGSIMVIHRSWTDQDSSSIRIKLEQATPWLETSSLCLIMSSLSTLSPRSLGSLSSTRALTLASMT